MFTCLFNCEHQFPDETAAKEHSAHCDQALGHIVYRCYFDITHVFITSLARQIHEQHCPTMNRLRLLSDPDYNIYWTNFLMDNKKIKERICPYSTKHTVAYHQYKQHCDECPYKATIPNESALQTLYASIKLVCEYKNIGEVTSDPEIPISSFSLEETKECFALKCINKLTNEQIAFHIVSLIKVSETSNQLHGNCYYILNSPKNRFWFLISKQYSNLKELLTTAYAIFEFAKIQESDSSGSEKNVEEEEKEKEEEENKCEKYDEPQKEELEVSSLPIFERVLKDAIKLGEPKPSKKEDADLKLPEEANVHKLEEKPSLVKRIRVAKDKIRIYNTELKKKLNEVSSRHEQEVMNILSEYCNDLANLKNKINI